MLNTPTTDPAASRTAGSERLTFDWLARRMVLWLMTLLFAVGGACALYATAGAREVAQSPAAASLVTTGTIPTSRQQ